MADNENVLTQLIFELEKFSLHKNGIEFKNKDNGTMSVWLMLHQTVLNESGDLTFRI